MQELRQSTEIKARIGSAADATDGVTPETGLTLGAADQAELLKHNGIATVDISGNTFAAVTGCDGWYDLTLTTGNTDTLGQLTAVIQDSSLMCPIFRDFMVVNQNYWDSKYSTDRLQVDVRELGDANLALTTQMKADVNAECDTSLTDYDSPTKAEADASFNLVISDTEDIQTQVGTAGAGLTDLGGMSTGMKAEINAECDTALTNYDAPTKAEIDVSFNALNDLSSSDVTTSCTSALNTYDPPTKGEMDTSFNSVITEVDANETKIDTLPTKTEADASFNGLNDLSSANVTSACTSSLNTYDPPTKAESDASFNALNDLSSSDVTTACTSSLNTYDAPTKTEMDASFNSLNDVSSSDVNAACDTALTDYNAPTKAEMDTSFNSMITEIDDNETKIDALPTKIEVDASFNALNDLSSANVTAACTSSLNTYDAPTKTEMDTSFNAVIADTEDIQTQIGTAGVGLYDLGGMSVAMMGEIQTEVNDALVAQNLDHLVKDPVDTSFANTVHLNSVIGNMTGVGGSATFSRSTDSAEAIRNRGDTAWTTGGAGSISEILNVQALIPNSIDLADTATVRIALGLTNMVDDLPTTAEITPGTITIDRKAIGATSWTTVVDASANSEAAGLVYYDEVFDSGAGYAAGDSIRITFKSQKITVDANDFEITGTDGWAFQTHIREAMVGTANAALATTALTDVTWTDEKAAFLDHSIATVDTVVDAIKTKTDNLPSGIAKNVALDDFNVFMVLSSDHVTGATGATVTCQISKDGGAFTTSTNSVTEVGSGTYIVDLTQAEMNADVIMVKFIASGCDARMITVYTG